MKEKFPEDWLEITYNDIGKFYGGGTPSTTNPTYWNGSIQWTTSKRLGDLLHLDSGERSISDNALKESSTTLIPKGNLLLGTRVGVGKIVVNRVDIAISQDLTGVIVDRSKYFPEFIAYQTREQRLQECFRKQKRGVTIQGVSRDDLKDFVLYVPPLAEQQKIATILYKIQKAIEIQGSIIEKTRELKKSTMHYVFSYGLRGEKLKETDIGPIPGRWDLIKIGECCDVRSSTISFNELNQGRSENNDVLCHAIKVSDMNLPGNEKYIFSANIETKLSSKVVSEKAIPANSVIFPKRGAAIATNKKRLTTLCSLLDPNLIAIIPRACITSEFLYYWFLTFDLASI
jgi:type I restriction enzyme, S subunit